MPKLSTRIIVAIIVGFLLAAFFTEISYGCSPEAPLDCGGLEFAILHPSDLLDNPSERGNFVETFLTGSLVSFAVFSLIARLKPKT